MLAHAVGQVQPAAGSPPAGASKRITTWDLRLKSPGFQHGVGLEFDDPRVTLSDNAFDLYANEPRVVRVTTPGQEPPTLLLRLPGQV